MSTSIMSSFFFLQMVENFPIFNKRMTKLHKHPVFEANKDDIMSSFSVIYTIMETQAVGFPISEEQLETSAALITAFSYLFCNAIHDPYIITQVMWEAYTEGDLVMSSEYYKSLHILSLHILKANASHAQKSK
jgi:hypothetical protein